jgi:hypothetical protein
LLGDIVQLTVDDAYHMLAGDPPLVADLEDASDIVYPKSEPSRSANEVEPFEDILPIETVP